LTLSTGLLSGCGRKVSMWNVPFVHDNHITSIDLNVIGAVKPRDIDVSDTANDKPVVGCKDAELECIPPFR
jgi:hypothetical protein